MMTSFAANANRPQQPAKTSSKPAAGGFTIVETLIVLAIAGLILMIVFLAIPTLIRNSRNNQRRQDVQIILGSVSHWELNHSGDIPNTPTDNFLQYDTSKLTYYDPSTEITSTTLSPGASIPAYTPNLDKVYIYNYQKCSAASFGTATPQGAGYNDVVALYAIETGNTGLAPQCQQL